MENTEQILDGNLIESTPNKNPNDNLAGTGKRLLNMIIDVIGYYALAFLIGIVFAIVGLADLITEANDTLLAIIIMLVYFISLESLFGKTLGKIITRTRVVTEDGSKPSFMNIVGRTLCRLIPFDGLSYLGGPTGWHDRFSKTLVINDKEKASN